MAAVVVTEPRTRKRRGALGPTYNPDETAALLDLVVTLTNPDGIVFDLTRRVVGGVGTLNEILEIELTDIGHSDIDLEVDDFDGLLEEFLGRLEPTDVWTVIIERESGKRRPKYVRLFGGILDLPWSLQYDREAKVVTFDVFAFSKLLERASAESVVRDWSALRLTNSAGTKIAAITGGISTLSVGDEFTVGLGTTAIGGRETHKIHEVRDQDGEIVTEDDWEFAHVAGQIMEPDTPYHRYVTPKFLVDELFDAAGISEREIDLPRFLFPIPVAININSFPLTTDADIHRGPKSLTIDGADIEARFRGLAEVEGKWESAGVSVRWFYTSGGTTAHMMGDWTAYQQDEPANHPILVNVALARDDGTYCFDFSRGDYYQLIQNGTALELHKNGVFNEVIDATANVIPDGANDRANLEYEPSQDELWISYWRAVSPFDSKIQYRAAGGGGWTTFVTGAGGGNLVLFRALGPSSLLWVTASGSPTTAGFWFRIIDPATHAYLADVPEVPERLLALSAPQGKSTLQTWTLRVMGDNLPGDVPKWVVGIGNILDSTDADGIANYGAHVFVWNIDKGFRFEGHRRVNAQGSTNVQNTGASPPLATVHREAGTEFPVYIGHVGPVVVPDDGEGTLFAVAIKTTVVPYADFDGKDVAEALKDLGAGTGCYVQVDENQIGKFVPRGPVAQSGIAPSLPEPLDQESLPIWEGYRSSVRVTGTIQTIDPTRADDFEVVLGPTGDSGRVLEIQSSVITTEAIANGIAQYFFDYVAELRRQENVTIPETGTLYRPFDQVELGGVRYMVLEAATDLESREQDLVLIEIL